MAESCWTHLGVIGISEVAVAERSDIRLRALLHGNMAGETADLRTSCYTVTAPGLSFVEKLRVSRCSKAGGSMADTANNTSYPIARSTITITI